MTTERNTHIKGKITEEEKFKEVFRDTITRCGSANLLQALDEMGFFTAPASAKYHGAYPGGLVEHSNCVYQRLVMLATSEDKRLKREHPQYSMETLAVVALLHDVCKADEYKTVSEGRYEKTRHFPVGHGEKSVIMKKLIETPQLNVDLREQKCCG